MEQTTLGPRRGRVNAHDAGRRIGRTAEDAQAGSEQPVRRAASAREPLPRPLPNSTPLGARSVVRSSSERRPASSTRTYGDYRAEILAALFHGAALIAIAILIVVEAWQRFRTPVAVHSGALVGVASGGLAVDLASPWVRHRARSGDVNLRGAWLHVFADTLGSVGAIVAGVLIWTLGWKWADPATSALIAALVVWSSWSLVRQALDVLIEGCPARIDVDRTRDAIVATPVVREVHDLHVWTIRSGLESLSAHVLVHPDSARADVLRRLQARLDERFGIRHVTRQIEEELCALEPRHP